MALLRRLRSRSHGSSCSRLCSCCSQPSQPLTWRRFRSKLPSKFLLKVYLVTFLNLFSTAFTITMLFPFLPFMVEFLIPELQDDQKSVGKYVGIVGGSLFLGRALGAYFWGALADKKGRKPIIVISSICLAIVSMAFGFSVNFAMAVISRFLVGFFNGTVATSKAVLSEVSDNSNQAFGLTLLSTAWGTGYIVGPAVAGALADPIGQYNLTINDTFLLSYFTRFPYSLPSIVNFFLYAISLVLTIFLLPETLGLKKNRKRSELDQEAIEMIAKQASQEEDENNDRGSSNNPHPTVTADIETKGGDNDESNDRGSSNNPHLTVAADVETSLCWSEDNDDNIDSTGDETRLLDSCDSTDSAEEMSRTSSLFITNPMATGNGNSSLVTVDLSNTSKISEEEGGVSRGKENGGEELVTEEPGVTVVVPVKKKWKKLCSVFLGPLRNLFLDLRLFFCDRASLIVLVLYSVYSFAVIGFSEIFSLWAYTDPHLGGLGLSLHQIGIVLTVVGVLMLPVSLVAFPLLEKRLHSIKSFYLAAIIMTFIYPLIPSIHYLLSSGHSWLFWGLLVTLVFVLNASTSIGFAAIFMFINNSVTFDKLGSINGVAMTLTSISRSFSPAVLGSIFSASLSDATLDFGFPVDYNLVFVILSVTTLTCVFMVACLPVSINHQKIIEDD